MSDDKIAELFEKVLAVENRLNNLDSRLAAVEAWIKRLEDGCQEMIEASKRSLETS